MTTLLERIIDSYEKLDVLVHLYRTRPGPQTARAIGKSLQLPPEVVTEVLASLLRAGIVRTQRHQDDVGWWFDPGSLWVSSIVLLVELHDIDRAELLEVMKYVGYQSVRPEAQRPMIFFGRRMRTTRAPN